MDKTGRLDRKSIPLDDLGFAMLAAALLQRTDWQVWGGGAVMDLPEALSLEQREFAARLRPCDFDYLPWMLAGKKDRNLPREPGFPALWAYSADRLPASAWDIDQSECISFRRHDDAIKSLILLLEYICNKRLKRSVHFEIVPIRNEYRYELMFHEPPKPRGRPEYQDGAINAALSALDAIYSLSAVGIKISRNEAVKIAIWECGWRTPIYTSDQPAFERRVFASSKDEAVNRVYRILCENFNGVESRFFTNPTRRLRGYRALSGGKAEEATAAELSLSRRLVYGPDGFLMLEPISAV